MEVFGNSAVARISPTMVAYVNRDLDLKAAKVLFASVDGRFAKGLKPWNQFFELKLQLEREGR